MLSLQERLQAGRDLDTGQRGHDWVRGMVGSKRKIPTLGWCVGESRPEENSRGTARLALPGSRKELEVEGSGPNPGPPCPACPEGTSRGPREKLPHRGVCGSGNLTEAV